MTKFTKPTQPRFEHTPDDVAADIASETAFDRSEVTFEESDVMKELSGSWQEAAERARGGSPQQHLGDIALGGGGPVARVDSPKTLPPQ